MKNQKKIHKDKNGCEFIKEAYFVDGKMKFNRVYVIDGIPADEFYENNATDIDFYLNGDYWLMSSEKESSSHDVDLNIEESDLLDDENTKDLPF